MITTDSHNLIYMNLKCLLCGIAILVCVGTVKAIDNVSERVSASISLKVPGNEAKQYPLTFQKTKNDKKRLSVEAKTDHFLAGLILKKMIMESGK